MTLADLSRRQRVLLAVLALAALGCGVAYAATLHTGWLAPTFLLTLTWLMAACHLDREHAS